MTHPTHPTHLTASPTPTPPHLAALAARTQEVEALRAELEETNRGVLALYSELDIQADQLRQATELKSRFLAYMSHEFRTPIVAIQSITRLLIDRVDGPLTPEQEKQVVFVRDTPPSSPRWSTTCSTWRGWRRARADVSPAWFDMVALFDALRGMFKPVLTNPEVSLIFEAPHDVPKLFSDDRKLSQILRNYISNALKFTPSGEIRVSAVCDGDDTITFSVRDTGIGIPAESHGEVFQDFVQIDSPLQRRYGARAWAGAEQAAGGAARRACGLRERSRRGLALLRDRAGDAARAPGRACRRPSWLTTITGHRQRATPRRWCWWWTTTRSRAMPRCAC